MRIIGGRFRRTPIAVVGAPGLRPTPDRVRETVFNWLEHLFGGLEGLSVLDLFAGTGALGFEAASRGAQRVVLVEKDARAVAALRAVQQRLDATGVEVLRDDWAVAAARLPPASFDLVFLDPPFDAGLLGQALAAAQRVLKPNGLIYAESARAPGSRAGQAAPELEVVRSGKAGAVDFKLLRAPAS